MYDLIYYNLALVKLIPLESLSSMHIPIQTLITEELPFQLQKLSIITTHRYKLEIRVTTFNFDHKLLGYPRLDSHVWMLWH